MEGNTHSSQKSLGAEAAEWYARLRAQDLSDIEAARFRSWLAANPERRREFEAVEQFWEGFSELEQSPEVVRGRAAIKERRRKAKRAVVQKFAAVTAAVLMLVGASYIYIGRESATPLATAIGEQRTVPLSDGSIITLNTNSEVRVDYSKARRSVELVRGQANFEVAKDAARPFIVRAGDSEVRAVGTVFDIYKTPDKVTVTLIEGKVAVGTGRAEVMLAAGEQLSYGDGQVKEKRSQIDVPRVTAWRARKLDFLNTPLAEAVAEANRYSNDEIVLQAPRLQA
ncbi:FecR family protein, partial [Steroidobacter sp.]|uniref:FecR family protein n=1 Tax=Steroidobacter sp. TaxID=1978227 RepID=UPI001A4A1C0E